MKKNRMMRAASAMLLAVLLTTCAISGTFAKYTTTAKANDSARVAKWGITATVTGSGFAEAYAKHDNTVTLTGSGDLEKSVQSSAAGSNVLAPGTSGDFQQVQLSGTPEVAVNIKHAATMELNGWEIKEGDATQFYCPVTITVNGYAIRGLDYDNAEAFKAEVVRAINFSEFNYAANTNMGTHTETYSWAWAFEGATGTEISQSDAYDTQLGNADELPRISLTVNTTITQID